MAQGDRKAAVDHLTALSAQDPILQRALLEIGIQKAVKGALADYDNLARTAGAYTAAHPES